MKYLSPLLALIAAATAQNNNINIPTGGLQVTAGQPITITWTDPSSSTVTIKLQQGSGVTPNSGITVLTSVPASDKTATFTIPADEVNSSQYNIEIIDDTDPSNYNFTPGFVIAGATCVGTCDGNSSPISSSISSSPSSSSTSASSRSISSSPSSSSTSASSSSMNSSESPSSTSTRSSSSLSTSGPSAAANTPSSLPSKSSSSLSAGAYAGIGVGATLIALLIIGALWFSSFRRRRMEKGDNVGHSVPIPTLSGNGTKPELLGDLARSSNSAAWAVDMNQKPEMYTTANRHEMDAAEERQDPGDATGYPHEMYTTANRHEM